MPVSFNSPARNLFLLGSAEGAVGNFFKTIDQSATNDNRFIPAEIRYIESEEKYVLSGSGRDNNGNGLDFGFIEKRDIDGIEDWNLKVQSTEFNVNTLLNDIKIDNNGNIIAAGSTGKTGVFREGSNIPWVAKYDNNGLVQWQSTTNSADVEYTGLAIDNNDNIYACGSTTLQVFGGDYEAIAFIEKFDSNGNPGWGKSAFMLGRNVVLHKCSVNSRGEVVAVGYLEDDSADKGYIVKIDTNTGEVLWDRTLTLTNCPIVNCEDVYVDNHDQIYIVGRTIFSDNTKSGFIIKYSAEGNIIWQRQTDKNESFEFHNVMSDGDTEQTIVIGTNFAVSLFTPSSIILSSYAKNGDLIWRRELDSINQSFGTFTEYGLDFDSSFYYIFFNESSQLNPSYTYARVSVSGNGAGNFEYDSGATNNISYDVLNITDEIGRLSDGSVRQDTSDLITYPFNANKLLFDDLATQVANKRRQMDSADSFEYSGSPAIRPADFQELNLLGDNVSDRIWNDTSGKGNNGVASLTEPFLGAGSVSFDGTSDYLAVTNSNDFDFDGTFTMEAFVYADTLAANPMIFSRGGGTTGGSWNTTDGAQFALYVTSTGVVRFEYNNGSGTGANTLESSAGSVVVKRWHHIAVTYDATTFTLWVDGVSVATGTGAPTMPTTRNLVYVGMWPTSANVQEWQGYISNLRFVKGTQFYTSNFTPPTTQLTNIPGTVLLTCQGDTIADASANNLTITVNGNAAPTNDGPTHNAAGYWEFDGVDDYIQLGFNTHFPEITLETWAYKNTANVYHSLIGKYRGDPAEFPSQILSYELLFNDANGIRFHVTGSPVDYNPSGGLSTNTWYHIVGTYSGTTVRIFVNGIEVASGSRTAGNNTVPWRIGASARGANFMNGRIGETRIYPRALTAAQVFQNYNATKTKYTNVVPDTAPKISDSAIVYDSNLLLNYDFGNRASYDSKGGTIIDTPDNQIASTENKIIASDGTASDEFGRSVAAGSNRIVVGAYRDDTGNSDSGSAYIFDLDGTELAKITSEEDPPGLRAYFGWSVAVGDDKVIVGALRENGNRGKAYIYDLYGNLLKSLTAPDRESGGGGLFGSSVAVGDGRIVIGAYSDDDSGSSSGAAYIFDLDGNFIAKITASDGAASAYFGVSVAVGSGKIVVGAYGDAEIGFNSGAAYIYDLDGTNEVKITASDGAIADYFGWSVAVGDDKVIVGARGAVAVAGAAYIYDLDGTNEVKITASDGAINGDEFGRSVAVGSGKIVVGAYADDDDGSRSGSAYIYDLDGTNEVKITASDADTNDRFGWSVAAGSDKIVVGSYLDDDNGSSSGSAYIYSLKSIDPPTTVKNLSSTSYTGTINGPTFNSAGYFEFDNTNVEIDIGNDILDAESAGTVEAWINTSQFGRRAIFSSASTTEFNRWWRFAVRDAGSGNGNLAIGGQFSGSAAGTSVEVQGALTLSPNTWHHVVGTASGTEWKLYVDGVEDTSLTVLAGSNAGYFLDYVGTGSETNEYNIGLLPRSSGETDAFEGNIGAFRIYNRVLTATEISQNFNATRSKYGV